MTQLVQQDYEAFIRYGIAQVTKGSVDEDAASAFPEARTVSVPDSPSASEEFADALRSFCLDTERHHQPR